MTGVIMSSGRVWQEQRKFMHATLNNLGLGSKDKMEAVIEQEAVALCDRIRDATKGGKPLKMSGLFLYTVNNVVWRILTGKKTKYNDPELLILLDALMDFFETLNPGVRPHMFIRIQ